MIHTIQSVTTLLFRGGQTIEKYIEAMRTLEAEGWKTDGGRTRQYFFCSIEPKMALVQTVYKEGVGVEVQIHLPDSVIPKLSRYEHVMMPGYDDMWVYQDGWRDCSFIISERRADNIRYCVQKMTSTLREHGVII